MTPLPFRSIWAYPRDLVERGADRELAELRELGFSAMSANQIFITIKLVSCAQSTLFHFMKNNLYIYKFTFH